MPVTISIVPASTQAGRETTRALLASEGDHTIRGFYRDPSKAPAEYTTNPNFHAIKGDISSGEGLAFEGSDAVLYIAPPTYDGSDEVEHATKTASNVKQAIESASSVKKLVLHSSMGAQNESGIVRAPYKSSLTYSNANRVSCDSTTSPTRSSPTYLQTSWWSNPRGSTRTGHPQLPLSMTLIPRWNLSSRPPT